jgi:hypothetical protein
MILLIISICVIVFIIIILGINLKLRYDVKKDYNAKFKNLIDNVNTQTKSAYEYDLNKTNMSKLARQDVQDISKSYVLKSEANKKLVTKELQLGNTNIKNIDNSLVIDKNLVTDNVLTKTLNAGNLTANTGDITNLKSNQLTAGSISVQKPGTLIGNSKSGLGNYLDGQTKVYSPNNVSLGNTDVLTVGSDRITQINGSVKIGNANNIKAGLTVSSSSGQTAGAFGGPDNWSYLSYTDGNTYLRSGKNGGEVNLTDATNINLKSSVVNVKDKLCVGSKCVDEKTFNNPTQANTKKLCLDNSCVTEPDIIKYNTMNKDITTISKQLTDIQTQIADINIKDCKVGDWTEWDVCSKNCGTGQQKRTRAIIQRPTVGGALCPHTVETKECNTQICVLDCDGTWNDWSSCPNSTGKKTRTFKINKPAEGGGKPCANKDGDVETQFCPIDCVGSFGELSACDPITGFKTRKYNITTQAAYAGKPCANNTGDIDKQSCPVDCVGTWTDWSACDQNTGLVKRTYNITTKALNGGKECPYVNNYQESKTCPIDCQYSWGGLSSCTASCGGGTQYKDPIISKQPQNGGQACPGRQTQQCNTQSCAIDCIGSWGDWSSCPSSNGKKTRTFKITTPAIGGGKQCSNRDGDIQTDYCPIDCVGNWNIINDCDQNTGFKTIRYNITTPVAYGGRECPYYNGLTDQQQCPVDCKFYMSPLSDCTTSCFPGTQYSEPVITAQPRNGGKPCTGKRQIHVCNKYSTCTGYNYWIDSSLSGWWWGRIDSVDTIELIVVKINGTSIDGYGYSNIGLTLEELMKSANNYKVPNWRFSKTGNVNVWTANFFGGTLQRIDDDTFMMINNGLQVFQLHRFIRF